jgi:glycosyltransferase involved in cell wall biosynthesis
MGLQSNLNFLIKKSSGDIIFISDQDDIWEPNKIEAICDDFQKRPSTDLVFHNSHILKMEDKEYKKNVFDIYSVSTNFAKNLLFFHVWGCMFAFRKRAKAYLIPLQGDFDVWIMLCSSFFKVAFIDPTPLMSYRRHSKNVSTFKKRHFLTIIISHAYNLLIFFALIIRTSLRFKKSRAIHE